MGFRISWLAVQGAVKPQLLERLGLADTGEPDEVNEAPFSVTELASGWTVLWSNDQFYAGETRAAELSRHLSPVLAVHVNETCMHSTAALFDGGERRWWLHHEGDERVDHLERDGQLPASTETTEARLRREQANADAQGDSVDYLFDGPLELAKSLCGFKHDECGD